MKENKKQKPNHFKRFKGGWKSDKGHRERERESTSKQRMKNEEKL